MTVDERVQGMRLQVIRRAAEPTWGCRRMAAYSALVVTHAGCVDLGDGARFGARVIRRPSQNPS